jgi:addiction module HigA family antidote
MMQNIPSTLKSLTTMRASSVLADEPRKANAMTMRELRSIHPGEMLSEDVLAELNMTGRELARALNVSPNRISEILRGRRAITADTALRLSR